jgi:hypothetical protein
VGSAADPRLELVKRTPLTLRGTGFASEERVVLTLRAGARRAVTLRVRAGSAGGFRASFGLLVATDPCEGTLVVTATGSDGSRATWKRACRPPSRPSG